MTDRSRPRVRVVCAEKGAYHDRNGRSTLAGYELVLASAGVPRYWSEVRGRSTRTGRADRAWSGSLTEAQSAAIENGEVGAPSSPFAGAPNPGLRPAVTEYLRGDDPAGDDSHHIEEALTRGTRSDSRSLTPARAEDAAGRGKVALSCGCGLSGALSAHAVDVWAVFDVLAENRIRTITLRALIARLEAQGAPRPH